MGALAAALAIALVAAVVVMLLRDRRAAREREGLARELRDAVPRTELSTALASRDAVMAAAATPVLLFDREGRVVRANPAAREAVPEVAGPESQPDLAAAAARAAAGEPVRDVELTVYAPERRRFRARIRPFGSGDESGAAVVLSDQSSEADYRDARRLFSAGVSHELRTPLQRILALVETLALPLDDEERSGMIAQARAEVDAMRQLIEDMILLVRLESHEIGDKDEQTDVTTAVEACVVRHTAAARAASMSLGTAVTRGLVAAVAPRLVDAVLDNLVENAIHHAGEGEAIVVRARGLSGAVEIVVHDTGGRIPPQHLGRVFERFYRIEDARSGPGTGLGLAIVKHIAEEYGGRATAESSLAGGTSLRVVLPAPAALRG
jgi:two-component system, OmpR family, phosphate regulon sensor histidine kinase PhoR